jgi:pyridoxal phosphate enzyme (YggS family)
MITNNLLKIKTQICEYEKKYHRPPHAVSLLAVSKKQTAADILTAFEAGQIAFGENYLQEALQKIEKLHEKSIEWHFIGPIQSNKTKKIAENFFWVHSVESIRIAERLNNQRPDTLPPLNICIEVNISDEKTKSGVTFDNTFALVEQCLLLPRLKVRGLMAIPAAKNTVEEQRAEFHKLTILFNKLREQDIMLDTLSMGMSDDYEAAIAEGSTLVRIGTAIFGARI